MVNLDVLSSLQNYYKNKNLKTSEALVFLRQTFLIFFLAQIILAVLISFIFSFLASPQKNDYLITTLIIMSIIQLPLAMIIGLYLGKSGGKRSALAATIVTAMLFSNPAWFAGFGFLNSKSYFYLLIQLLILAIYYAIGILICGQYAKISFLDKNNDSSK